MTTKVFSDAMGVIDNKYIEEAAIYRKMRKSVPWGKLSAIAACIVFALVLFIPTLTRQNQNIITENEPRIELSMDEATKNKTFGMLFPKQILEGYVLEDTPCIYGVGNNAVLKAIFSNEELGDEMVIRIASREWFHSHEQESTELNTIHYNEHLVGVGSYIYFESGENIICYSFTTRDIAQVDGFWDMVNSAEQITGYSGE